MDKDCRLSRLRQVPILLEKHSYEVVMEFERQLRAVKSSLVSDPATRAQTRILALNVLQGVARDLRSDGPIEVDRGGSHYSRVIGTCKSRENENLDECLGAMSVLFGVVLSAITAYLPPDAARNDLTWLALVIYQNVADATSEISTSYMESLLDRREAAPLSVLLVGGSKLFRQGLAEMLTMKEDLELGQAVNVVGQAGDLMEAFPLLHEMKPEVVLLVADASHVAGCEISEQVVEAYNFCKLVLLVPPNVRADPWTLVECGADAYVHTDVTREGLLAVVRATVREDDRVVFSMSRTAAVEKSEARARGVLTGRQLEILTLAAEGKSNGQIAETLCLSEATVKRHLANIYERLQVGSRVEAAAKVLSNDPIASYREFSVVS